MIERCVEEAKEEARDGYQRRRRRKEGRLVVLAVVGEGTYSTLDGGVDFSIVGNT